ncbi:hypothetical protein Bhyg_12191 [Pseudolycoriella hygida]|uniref:Uncharacterized protein n=1 Tax=Pseudolycoriella hygida TaxID=35572 RepID=A0A9Q0MWR8_9DIPT|nr:hypothetical protein Bhyg_12191 [Pseudolycoriella hygida]
MEMCISHLANSPEKCKFVNFHKAKSKHFHVYLFYKYYPFGTFNCRLLICGNNFLIRQRPERSILIIHVTFIKIHSFYYFNHFVRAKNCAVTRGHHGKNKTVEDKFLLKLVKKGKINKSTKPASLKSEHPTVFGEFSTNVIRNHLALIKRSSGMYYVEEGNSKCAEPTKVVSEVNGRKVDDNAPRGYDTKLMQQNYPVICEQFKDPETEINKVLLVALLPGGATNIKVELHERGLVETMFNANDLFKRQLQENGFQIYHPMVLSFKAGLKKARKRVNARPESTMKVELPLEVQTSEDSWKRWGESRADGSQILLVEFSSQITDYVKKSVDECVVFHK